MICTPIPGGFVCGRSARRPKCFGAGLQQYDRGRVRFRREASQPGGESDLQAKLCAACSVVQSDGKDFCAPHDRLAKRLKEKTDAVR